MWKYFVKREIWNLSTKYAENKIRQRKINEATKEINDKYNAHVTSQEENVVKFGDRIKKANNYLIEIVNVELKVEKHLDRIKQHFSTPYQRLGYHKISLSPSQTKEIFNMLDIKHNEYVPSGYMSSISIESTVAFIISKTDVILKINESLKKEKLKISVNVSQLDKSKIIGLPVIDTV